MLDDKRPANHIPGHTLVVQQENLKYSFFLLIRFTFLITAGETSKNVTMVLDGPSCTS